MTLLAVKFDSPRSNKMARHHPTTRKRQNTISKGGRTNQKKNKFRRKKKRRETHNVKVRLGFYKNNERKTSRRRLCKGVLKYYFIIIMRAHKCAHTKIYFTLNHNHSSNQYFRYEFKHSNMRSNIQTRIKQANATTSGQMTTVINQTILH